MTRVLLAALIVLCGAPSAVRAELTIVVDRALGATARRALDELSEVIAQRDRQLTESRSLPDTERTSIVIGLVNQSPLIDRLLAEADQVVPQLPESLAILRRREVASGWVVAGRDERGLTYALRELTRAVELVTGQENLFRGVVPAIESPYLAVRNVSVHLFNADLEQPWYFSEEFWRSYLKQLSLARLNHLTLTFSDQTNYLCPLYAYLVDLPEFPEVRAADCSPVERARNLAMLRRIGELAAEYGVELNLGIWMQAPVERWSAPVRVTGLPTGLEHARYCALGLQRILAACPAIHGVQLRMNAEAGVDESQQTEFYRPMFRAIRTLGRPIRLDLRYKGLQPSTIQAALDEQLDVTVSTKYWAEHFGLPYHPTSVDSHWRDDRYSFGSLLRQPRAYRVVYQLWNVGSQRISLWGDPDYARRFVESCTLGGGEGFEVFAPLTNQGYGNEPGHWPVVANPEYRVGRWPHERYWFFYLCFGRLGYNPRTATEVWQREFRERFGTSAKTIEAVYRAASEVLPLITAARLPGASEWSWWPELDTGGELREYVRMQPSDPRQFYAIRTWQPTDRWRWEAWDAAPEYVEDLLAEKRSGKWTPWQVADRLEAIAERIALQLSPFDQLQDSLPRQYTAEHRLTQADAWWLSWLGRYHAEKLRAATGWALYEATGSRDALHLADKHLTRAIDAWKQIVARTENVYHHRLVFGISTTSPRSKLGHHHTGHWRDRLPELLADLARVRAEIAEPRVAPSHTLPADLQVRRPTISATHTPPAVVEPNRALPLRLQLADPTLGQRVMVHYRPLDQTRDWRQLDMQRERNGGWSAKLPAEQIDPQFDLQYYFELLDAHGGALWPDWTERTPYFVVPVRRP